MRDEEGGKEREGDGRGGKRHVQDVMKMYYKD